MTTCRCSAARTARHALPIVLAVAGLAGCATVRESASVPPTLWTADLHAPELPSAIGFLARVPDDGHSLELVVLEAMGFDGGPVAGFRRTGDSLTFTWTSENNRACILTRRDTPSYEGTCAAPGHSTWKLRLLPPALRSSPVGHAHSIIGRVDYGWTSTTHQWGRLHAPGTIGGPSVDVPRMAARIDSALTQGLRILGVPAYDRPIDAFLVSGREDLRALTGRASGSTADALGSTVILASFGEQLTVVRHEVMHVLSINLWGVPPEPAAWLREGIATFAGGGCAGYSLHQLAANMKLRGELLPIRTLVADFYRHSDLITYLESGSLFQFIHESHGLEVARDVWQRGLEPALGRRGITIDSLEEGWLRALSARDLRPEAVDWTRIRGIGCG